MNLSVKKIEHKEWLEFSDKAHFLMFNAAIPKELIHEDYALLCTSNEHVLGYVTCRAKDLNTIYWQLGGAFPDIRKTVNSFKVFAAFVNWAREKYDRIMFHVNNKNTDMLRFAMKVGFLIVGLTVIQGEVYLEHLLQF